MAHMICTCALRCYWECLGEHLKNPLGIWLEHTPPFPQPITSKLKRKVKIKINLVGMHVKASRWPHEIFIFKIVCHHFQHKSMGTSSYCVRIESIKSFVSFKFFVHAWMKTRNDHRWWYNLPTTWVIQLCLQENFPKVERSFFHLPKINHQD